jgi:hypothetical protein
MFQKVKKLEMSFSLYFGTQVIKGYVTQYFHLLVLKLLIPFMLFWISMNLKFFSKE